MPHRPPSGSISEVRVAFRSPGRHCLTVACLLLAPASLWAAPATLAGDWKTPGGSIVRVGPCGPALCLTLIKVAPDVQVSTDARNPDPAFKSRPLCGLRVGDGFVAQADGTASGGHLYDPQSGRTYSGKITPDGDHLKLRGYIGVSLFGRSEVWNRVAGHVDSCM